MKVGDTFKIDDNTYEVIHESAQGDGAEQHHFVYEIQLQSEVQEKRALEKAQAEQAANEASKQAMTEASKP